MTPHTFTWCDSWWGPFSLSLSLSLTCLSTFSLTLVACLALLLPCCLPLSHPFLFLQYRYQPLIVPPSSLLTSHYPSFSLVADLSPSSLPPYQSLIVPPSPSLRTSPPPLPCCTPLSHPSPSPPSYLSPYSLVAYLSTCRVGSGVLAATLSRASEPTSRVREKTASVRETARERERAAYPIETTT